MPMDLLMLTDFLRSIHGVSGVAMYNGSSGICIIGVLKTLVNPLP